MPDGKRAALLITSVLPWPIHRNGGGQRTEIVRRALLRLGFEVRIVALVPESGGGIPDDLDRESVGIVEAVPVPDRPPTSRRKGPLGRLWEIGVDLPRGWASRFEVHAAAKEAVERAVRQWAPELIVSRYLPPAAQCDLIAIASGARTVLDFDDADWLAVESRLAAEPWAGIGGRIGMRRVVAELRRRGRPIAAGFDAVLVPSPEDADAVTPDLPRRPTVLPNLPFSTQTPDLTPAALPPSPGESNVVLFVGDLQHWPNRKGLDRFVSRTWPIVVEARPDARFRIVGRGMAEEQREAWRRLPGVEPVGFADDLRAEYEQAALAVVPAFGGGGTKIKVPEAAAMGRAQVVTPDALRGFAPLADAVVVAPDGPTFARSIAALLIDLPGRRRLESAGPAIVAQHYGFDAAVDALRKVTR
jgi:glycosyltransferase involved in cell wall biosynthesis